MRGSDEAAALDLRVEKEKIRFHNFHRFSVFFLFNFSS
jgi:hypothetical protein